MTPSRRCWPILGAALAAALTGAGPTFAGRGAPEALCDVQPSVLSAQSALVGQPAIVQVDLGVTCRYPTMRGHVVLAFEDPGSWRAHEKREVARIVGDIADLRDTSLLVGAVASGNRGHDCRLADAEKLRRCALRLLSAKEGADAESTALSASAPLLARGRSLLPSTDWLYEVVILFARSSPSEEHCQTLIRDARDVKREALLAAVSVGDQTDACLADVALSPRYQFSTEQPAQLRRLLLRVYSSISVYPRRLSLILSPADAMPVSAAPGSERPVDDGTGLTWTWEFPAGPQTARFLMTPKEPGEQPVARRLRAEVLDNFGGTATIEIEVPTIQVFGAPEPISLDRNGD